MLKRVLLTVIISFLIITIHAQVTGIGKLKFDDTKPGIHSTYSSSISSSNQNWINSNLSKSRFDTVQSEKITKGTQKSPGLAFLFSLLVPGTGQLYKHRLDVGKYYMISEAALWLGFASFTIYGNWLLKDAHKFAQIHAGVNQNGKDDNFFVNISNYNNVYEYNDNELRNGRYD